MKRKFNSTGIRYFLFTFISLVTTNTFCVASPITVFTSEAAFDAAINNATTYSFAAIAPATAYSYYPSGLTLQTLPSAELTTLRLPLFRSPPPSPPLSPVVVFPASFSLAVVCSRGGAGS